MSVDATDTTVSTNTAVYARVRSFSRSAVNRRLMRHLLRVTREHKAGAEEGRRPGKVGHPACRDSPNFGRTAKQPRAASRPSPREALCPRGPSISVARTPAGLAFAGCARIWRAVRPVTALAPADLRIGQTRRRRIPQACIRCVTDPSPAPLTGRKRARYTLSVCVYFTVPTLGMVKLRVWLERVRLGS